MSIASAEVGQNFPAEQYRIIGGYFAELALERELVYSRAVSGSTNNAKFIQDIIKNFGKPAYADVTDSSKDTLGGEGRSSRSVWDLGDLIVHFEWYGGSQRWHVTVAGKDFESIESLLKDITKLIPDFERDKEEGKVTISFWMFTAMGVMISHRSTPAPSWDEIHSNYSQEVDESFASLKNIDKGTLSTSGRLILLYGPAGTGKTYAIRALANEWKDWVESCYILDANMFLTNPQYMLTAVMSSIPRADDDEYGHGNVDSVKKGKWRLFILEDANELIAADARDVMGQALGQLLNITDGLIGQGSNIMILITTNEPMDKLHEAVARPGRAIAKIKFDKLDTDTANNWLKEKGSDVIVDKEHSLAELYALLKNTKQISAGTAKKKRAMGFSTN